MLILKMGRDVTGLRIGRALDSVHGTAKIINERAQPKKQVVKDPDPKGMANEASSEKLDVLTVRNINTEVGSPGEEIKAVTLKPTDNPLKTHHGEEDAHSLASSAAISMRSNKAKVTVPVAPTFRAAERAERRKEFQKKLEEKQKALEAERLEYVARTKEEEEKVIKQLRKSMAYKANHVPSFYHKGPPPKVELKKLPVTRPKSPNLTRRKSHSDVVKPSTDEKKCSAKTTRLSIDVCKDVSAPKSKDVSGTRNANGPSKFKHSNGSSKVKVARPKEVKDTTVTLPTELEQKIPDIFVVSETKTTNIPEQLLVPSIVEVKMSNSGTVNVEDATETTKLSD